MRAARAGRRVVALGQNKRTDRSKDTSGGDAAGLAVSCGGFFFSSRRRHTRYWRDWSSDVCSSDLGEILQIKEVINSMVDRLSVFADEVTRVAREVGTEGVLGGQAEVPNVAGTWKDLKIGRASSRGGV